MNKNHPLYPLCDMVNNADTWQECINTYHYPEWVWIEVPNGFALKHDRFMSINEHCFFRCKELLNKVRGKSDE